MGVCTPCITPRSAVIIKRMEFLHVELPARLEEYPGMIRIPKSPSYKSCSAWRTLKYLSRNPTREARNATVMKKVTATQTPLEVLGQVVPGKIKLRNLKLMMD